jgi:hypothetical protein
MVKNRRIKGKNEGAKDELVKNTKKHKSQLKKRIPEDTRW